MRYNGTPVLESDRLILRRFTLDDAQAMYENWASDTEVTRYLSWPAHTNPDITRQLISFWIDNYKNENFFTWAIVLKEDNTLVGSISVIELNDIIESAEIGYCMGKKWWGKGYMPEALGEVIAYLFDEVGVNRIYAGHDVNNPKSGRVMSKAGMRFEGIMRQGGKNNTGTCDVAIYSVLQSDV
ncbi:MAG: GNAT family N-acetyltransferase [Clostridia bacterium]|nr:GNAT family N-acetyltransferase [Clostridia bacterium]